MVLVAAARVVALLLVETAVAVSEHVLETFEAARHRGRRMTGIWRQARLQHPRRELWRWLWCVACGLLVGRRNGGVYVDAEALGMLLKGQRRVTWVGRGSP